MNYYEIVYRKSYYCIGKKYVKSEYGATDAIRKTGLNKSIIDVVEITKEQFDEYRKVVKERADAKKAVDGFII